MRRVVGVLIVTVGLGGGGCAPLAGMTASVGTEAVQRASAERARDRERRRVLFDRVKGCVNESTTSMIAVTASFHRDGDAWSANVAGAYDLRWNEITCIAGNLAATQPPSLDEPDHTGDATVAWTVLEWERSPRSFPACTVDGAEVAESLVTVRHVPGFEPVITFDDDVDPRAHRCIASALTAEYAVAVVSVAIRIGHKVRIRAPQRVGPARAPYDATAARRILGEARMTDCHSTSAKPARFEDVRVVFEPSGKVAAVALDRPVRTKADACVTARLLALRVAPFSGLPVVEKRRVPSQVVVDPNRDLD